MAKFLYPIYKLPDEYVKDYEKRNLPQYMKWWLYKRTTRKEEKKQE